MCYTLKNLETDNAKRGPYAFTSINLKDYAMRHFWLVTLLCVVLSGCGSSGNSSSALVSSVSSHSGASASATSQYEGYWQSDANGRATGLTESDLKTLAIINEENTSAEINNLGLVPGALLTKVESPPWACTQALMPVFGDEGYQFDAARDYQFFWDYFYEYYLDFGLTDTDWAKIYETYLLEAQAATSEEHLFDIFAKMIDPLTDPHVYIALNRMGEGHEQAEHFHQVYHKPPIVDVLTQEFLTAHQLSATLSDVEKLQLEIYIEERLDDMVFDRIARAQVGTVDSVFDELLWFVTEDNIGYLLIASRSDYGGQNAAEDYALIMDAMETIVSDLSATEGLVIDIRINNAGYDLVNAAIASYFFDTPTEVYAKQARLGAGREALRPVVIRPNTRATYTRPVALLTSHSTVSAAEAFTLMMRERPQTAIIGEPTAGAFSDMLEARVTSRLFFSLSNEWYLDNQGQSFEKAGVPVDWHVPFPSPAGEDHGLDQAIVWLQTGRFESP